MKTRAFILGFLLLLTLFGFQQWSAKHQKVRAIRDQSRNRVTMVEFTLINQTNVVPTPVPQAPDPL